VKRATTLVFLVLLILSLGTSAQAIIIFGTGTPSDGTDGSNMTPIFANLVNFDDKATGTAVLSNDYVAQGIASITETEGLGFFARYAGSQSQPNYVGTGLTGERGTDANMGWDGTILIKFANLTFAGGIGVADSQGGPETITLLDYKGNVLGSEQVPNGLNVYVTFYSTTNDIAALKIKGDYFSIDDLQWSHCPCPVPAPISGSLVLLGSGLLGLVGIRRKIS
jgi:hypothetical protein